MTLPNTIGSSYAFTCFGESHGRCIGVVIDGCPAGLQLAETDIQKLLDLRKPGQSIVTTQRAEQDRVEILSGVFKGNTTGAPICLLVWNSDTRSSDYDKFVNIPRPGHADYPALIKYGAMNDYRGGGRFSGRITAGFVMAGAVAQKLIEKVLSVKVFAFTRELGGIRADGEMTHEGIIAGRYSNEVRCPDQAMAERMRSLIIKARGEGDSLGGVVECRVIGLPIGVGEPVFSSLESELSRSIFSIPAVKGIEFGSGFAGTGSKGSENNDAYVEMKDGRLITRTNNSGGVLGGMTTGMPLVFRVAFKPASSIASPQETMDLSTREKTKLQVPGRHDPTVVPRAVPVVECMTACVLTDLAIKGGFIPPVLLK
ncbi:MAG: chorismate synthase [Nitrososphaerales archaeon]